MVLDKPSVYSFSSVYVMDAAVNLSISDWAVVSYWWCTTGGALLVVHYWWCTTGGALLVETLW